MKHPSEENEAVRLVVNTASGHYRSQALYVVSKLGVPDLIQRGCCTSKDMAQAASVDEHKLYQVMRYLSCLGFFVEGEDRSFQLQSPGELLLKDHPQSQRPYVLMHNEQCYQACGAMLHGVRSGEIPFEHVFGTSLFEFHNSDVEAGDNFQAAMQQMTVKENPAILNAFDFSEVKTVADIGGGNGTLLSALLSDNPHLNAILFDRPEVIETSRVGTNEWKSRCKFVGGNFLEEVAAGADLYVLKQIIHDWPDEQVLQILRCCRKAMKKECTLLVMEFVIGAPNKWSAAIHTDIVMMTMFGGANRRLEDIDQLLAASRFETIRLIETEAPISIIQARAC